MKYSQDANAICFGNIDDDERKAWHHQFILFFCADFCSGPRVFAKQTGHMGKLIVCCTGYQQASLTIQITKYRLPVCLRLFFPLNG
ncbi:hypothetical protein L584_17775 [Pantoea agglomerans Tx10]|nr:hypothetical protein L584_17775 [Pantoea agglomerans Tx10]KJH54405.1 hypothetical protein UF13_22030 [Pantoea agglomerans]